jgi:Holliday junction resolvase
MANAIDPSLFKNSPVKKKNKKTKELSSEQVKSLTKLIEMEDPEWVNPEIFENLFEDIEEYNFKNIDECIQDAGRELGIGSYTIHPEHGYIQTQIKASKLYEMYISGNLISTVYTGQDPKYYSKENIKHAGSHAANHWGTMSSSWHMPGAMNFLKINTSLLSGEMLKSKQHKYVLDCVDIEHRLWGMIAFQMDLVAIRPSDGVVLYFEHPSIKNGKISVNGKRLSQIVDYANRNLKKGSVPLTKEDVLKRFDVGAFPLILFPMWAPQKCHNFYFTINGGRVEKTIPQLFHSESSGEIMTRIKELSSPKYSRSKSSRGKLLPFFENHYSDSSKESLRTFMDFNLVLQMVIEGMKFVPSSDSKIRSFYDKTNGYSNHYDDDVEKMTVSIFEALEPIFAQRHNNKEIKPQHIQQVVMLCYYISDLMGCQIGNDELFGQRFFRFIENNMTEERKPGQTKSVKTEFGTHMGYGDLKAYHFCHKHIIENLILRDEEGNEVSKDNFDNHLLSLGIERLPKFSNKFTPSQIMASKNKQEGLDIDRKPFHEKKGRNGKIEGAHAIPNFELEQYTAQEVDAAAIREGIAIDGKSVDSENCIAMSFYHNRRMKELPLSKYLPIMHESDEVVKKAIEDFKKSVSEFVSNRYNRTSENILSQLP